MNQQLPLLLKLFGVALSLWLFTLPVGAQEMTFMESPFDPATDQAQLLPADQKGSVSWTAATRTLTLRDVQINTISRILTGWMHDEITIQVEGTNQIVCTGSDDAITMRSSVRITGPGSLSITSEQAYAYACRSGASLTIADGVSVTAIGLNGGLVGDFLSSHLLIDKAYVTASTINDQGAVSIGYFKELTLEGCAITSPSGAKVAELNEVMSITLDGKDEYAGKVIIAPQQSYHKVTIAQAEHGRIVAPEGVDLTHLLAGSAVTFTAEPEDGYALTKLMAGTEDITNTRTLIVKADVTVTPTFSPVKSYRVSLQKPEHGTLTVKEQEYDLTKVPEGAILHFICTPNKGYELEQVKAGDEDITKSLYIKVHSDVQVTAQYKLIPIPTYRVAIKTLGAGTVTADYPNLEAVPEGTTVHFTCTPKDDQHFLIALKANGEDIMESKSITIEDEDVNVIATFKQRTAIDAPQGVAPTIARTGDALIISGVATDQPVALITLLGETLLRTSIQAGESLTVSIESFPAGAYLLTIGDTTYKINL